LYLRENCIEDITPLL
jgi:Leucine-rich repeat (LRR) protein